ncbi:MAG: hypothetical protein IJ683_06860 [Butyrivibrio sp.]|nr:hypothetical protein [Butyrivibrio sp.]MBR1642023.1 hypothetical protein [Butyrivibrio sp.]
MANTINEIIGVKVAEQIFDVEKLQPGRTWVTELSEDGIVTYYTEYKSRKKHDIVKTEVPVQEMRSFFKELYDFARGAEDCFITIDDCSRRVTFIYGPMHKEIFEGETTKGGRSLTRMIEDFAQKHR